MADKVKIISILADLHIGNKRCPADVFKAQLEKHYFAKMELAYRLDAIFVLGDLMHTIVSLNSDYSELFHWFISRLYKLARKTGCSVLILKGTPSHDNDQLNTIKHYQNNADDVDFRVFDHITVTELFGWRILVLPDVRVKKDSDIEDYLNDGKYDIILGHGTIDKMQFVQQESENMPMKSYVYKCKDLCKCSRGPVLFGHIHQYHEYYKKFYYCGSFTLLERGNTDAGYLMCAISTKDPSKYLVDRIINTDSPRYFDIKLDVEDVLENSIEDICEAIDYYIEDASEHDLISLRINRDNSNSTSDKVLMIESRYKPDRRISIIKKIITPDEEEKNNKLAERKDKYSYMFDPELSVPEIMFRYYEEDVRPTLNPESPAAKLDQKGFFELFDLDI